jgi:hypothetical protein
LAAAAAAALAVEAAGVAPFLVSSIHRIKHLMI